MKLENYQALPVDELKERVAFAKRELGKRLIILGHYYQQEDVIEFVDVEGDSFQLAKAGAEAYAEFIVFCGVRFMADVSCVLAKKGQRVFLPDMSAGCPLADMATIDDVERAWGVLEKQGLASSFLPVTYINSSVELKAFCARHGGTVCTSSSARKAFEWTDAEGKRMFFFPDENLGRNTAYAMGMKKESVACFDPKLADGGLTARTLDNARAIVWKGFCHVHTLFSVEHIRSARKKYPDCSVIVHPECNPYVVKAADFNGSTAFLKKYAEDAPAGSAVVIGTEINLVSRLAKRLPDKKIAPLARSLCPNMFKVSLADLCYTLENMGQVNEVFVENGVAKEAKIALDRMLSL